MKQLDKLAYAQAIGRFGAGKIHSTKKGKRGYDRKAERRKDWT